MAGTHSSHGSTYDHGYYGLQTQFGGCLALPDSFHVGKFTNSRRTQFAAKTGILNSTKGELRVGNRHAVDKYGTSIKLVEEKLLLSRVIAPN